MREGGDISGIAVETPGRSHSCVPSALAQSKKEGDRLATFARLHLLQTYYAFFSRPAKAFLWP